MRNRRKSTISVEKFLKAIDELRERSKGGWVIVVEGKNDEEALKRLGICGEIVIFSGYVETADRIKDRKTIILTDFDEKGMEIEMALVRSLSTHGNVPDVELKKKLFLATGREVVHVEALATFYEKLICETRIGKRLN